MSSTVGVTELRQNLSAYLRRVGEGERLTVIDHSRPVAELGPAPNTGSDLDRLIAEGRVSRPLRSGLPEPLELTGDPYALSRALEEVRADSPLARHQAFEAKETPGQLRSKSRQPGHGAGIGLSQTLKRGSRRAFGRGLSPPCC